MPLKNCISCDPCITNEHQLLHYFCFYYLILTNVKAWILHPVFTVDCILCEGPGLHVAIVAAEDQSQ